MPDFKIRIVLDNATAKAMARAQADALKDVAEAAKQAGDAADDAGKRGGKSFGDMAVTTGLAVMGLHKMAEAARAFGEAIETAAARQEQMTRGYASTRDKLAELQAIQGKTLTDQAVTDFAAFQVKTRMTEQEALAFKTSYFNTGAQHIGKRISESESDQLQEQLASLAVARGLPGGIVGDLGGQLLGFKDWQGQYGDQASEQVTGIAYTIMQGLGRGRGDNPALLRASNRTQQTMHSHRF